MSLNSASVFSAQLERVKLAAGVRTLAGLAEYFGVGLSLVSDAYRRGLVPWDWLTVLARVKGVNPEWTLTNNFTLSQ